MKTFARINKHNFVSKLLTKRVFLLVAGILATGAGIATATKANATEYTFNVTVPETPVLEVSLKKAGTQTAVTGGSIEVVPTMATASFDEVGVDVIVGTSNANGFNLVMNTTTALTDSSTGATIPSLVADSEGHANGYTCTAATGATCDFTLNSWGFKVTSATTSSYSETNYLPIPSGPTQINSYSGVTDGVTTTFYFGSRVNAAQTPGTYTTTINFIATATIENILYMQDGNLGTILAGMDETKDIGDTFYLYDNRDSKAYLIGKLKDGKYWMLENLALDPNTTTVTLSSANTNMPAQGQTGYDAATAFATTFAKGSDSDGIIKTSGFTSYTVPMINVASKNQKRQLAMLGDTTITDDLRTEPVGVYYNYCAATVGTYCSASDHTDTDSAEYDICPAGWRLPTGGAVTASGGGEFQNLRNKYSSNADFVNALRTPLSGSFYDSSARYQGSYGYFWSSTYYSATSMYRLGVGATNVYPQDYGVRYNGFSVRCVYDGS